MRLRTVGVLPLRSSARLVALALLAACLLRPSAAGAQGLTGRSELTVFGGVSLAGAETTDPDRVPRLEPAGGQLVPALFLQRASLDGSAELGVRFDHYLTGVLSIGGDFSVAPNHRYAEHIGFGCSPGRLCILAGDAGTTIFVPDQVVETRVTAYHYGVNVGIDLVRGAIRPAIIGGLGAATYDHDLVGATHFAVRVGGALKAEAGPVTWRLEVIDILTPNQFATGRSEHDVHVRVGVGVRWPR
ncbi:MAG TPA: hypothetical protein VLA20_06200 [Vicinamibacterales bacterium]|nr:hypothetical protein [Vicinamibacterales bacterium]